MTFLFSIASNIYYGYNVLPTYNSFNIDLLLMFFLYDSRFLSHPPLILSEYSTMKALYLSIST